MRFWVVAIFTALMTGACNDPEANTAATADPAIAVTPQTAGTSAAPEFRYRWHTAEAGKSVQYGFPGTDNRLLRIDCIDGRITIGGPAGVNGPEGGQVTVTFGKGDGAQTLPAVLAEAGDGMNFYADVRPDDPALQTLLAGHALQIVRGEYRWEVPGDGAAAELIPFMRACRASTP